MGRAMSHATQRGPGGVPLDTPAANARRIPHPHQTALPGAVRTHATGSRCRPDVSSRRKHDRSERSLGPAGHSHSAPAAPGNEAALRLKRGLSHGFRGRRTAREAGERGRRDARPPSQPPRVLTRLATDEQTAGPDGAAARATPPHGTGAGARGTLREGGVHVYAGFDVLGPRRAAATRPVQDGETVAPAPERRAVGAQSGGTAPEAERAYLRQIARTTLLTREAEIELGERIATGER